MATLAPGALQFGNIIATPNANVTAAQTAAATSAGWKPAAGTPASSAPIAGGGSSAPQITFDAQTGQPSNSSGFKVVNGTKVWVDSNGDPLTPVATPSTNSPTAIPDGHSATGYVVPPYNATTGAGSLNSISAETGVPTTGILAANPTVTNPNTLYPGQVLGLPNGNTSASGYTPASSNPPAAAVSTATAATPGITQPAPAPSPAPAGTTPAAAPSGTAAVPAATTDATVPTGSSYIQGSGSQQTIDQQTADQVAALTSYYTDQSSVLNQTHEQAQNTLNDYISQLQARNDAQVANINDDYNIQGTQLAIKQGQTVGQDSMALARMGGYLGDSASGISYLNSLNNANALAVNALQVSRNQAIQAANDAISDKSFAAAQAKVTEAKAFNDSIQSLFGDTFNKVQTLQTNDLNRQKSYLDNQNTVSTQMAPALVAGFNGDIGHDRALAEQAAIQSGGQVSADSLMSAARAYQLQVQQVNQAGTHFFPVNDPITGQPVSVTKVNPDGSTENLSLSGAMQAGYTGVSTGSGVTGISASGSTASAPAATTPVKLADGTTADTFHANSNGSETVNGKDYTFRTITSNDFHSLPNGKAYVDISSSPNKSIAALEAQKLNGSGVLVVSDPDTAKLLNNLTTSMQNVDLLESKFTPLASNTNNIFGKGLNYLTNFASPVFNQNRSNALNAYEGNQNGLLNLISSFANSSPKTTGNLLGITSASLPDPNRDTVAGGKAKLDLVRNQLVNSLDSLLGTKTDMNDVRAFSNSNITSMNSQNTPVAPTLKTVVDPSTGKSVVYQKVNGIWQQQ